MANTTIQIKKSATPAATPSSLANGELAINYADGKLFYKAANGTIVEFSTSDGNNFGTVNANGTLLVSDTQGDVFSIVPGNNITIVGDAVNDKLTIGLADNPVVSGTLHVQATGGIEGGQIELGNATSSSTLAGNVVIDVYGDKLRFYEKDSPNKGAFIDLGIAGSGVSTNLLATSGGTTDATARATAEAAFAKANAALPNTNGVTFAGTLTVSSNLNADRIISTNNGNGENFKVGDDAWIGDTNLADTIRIKGQQNPSNAFIALGDNDGVLLGRSGSGNLTYGGNTVWHAGNDGAGSGLDADLLDGQQGSYYSEIGSAAFDKANSANLLAFNTGIGANAFASATIAGANTAVGAGANNYANATFVKLDASSQTITGDLNIVGNLSFTGNTTFSNVTTLQVNDPLIYLAANNYSSDLVDIGFIANYVNATGSNVHTGLYREHENKMYYLFQGYDREPINNHIGALSNNMTLAVLNADMITSNLTLAGVNSVIWIRSAYDKANDANLLAYNTGIGANAFAAATIAGANTAVGGGANSVGSAAFTRANTSNTVAIANVNYVNTAMQAAFSKANNAFANATGTLAGSLTTTGSLTTAGTITANAFLYVSPLNGGIEGGQIELRGAGPYDDWTIDSYYNQLRIFTNSSNTNQIWINNIGAGTANLVIDGFIIASGMNLTSTISDAYDRANTSNTVAIANVNYVNTAMQAAFSKANSTLYTSNVVISVVDNTNAALRITQTGTGNALLVEDASNPDSTPFVVNADGNVGVGNSSPSQKLVVQGATVVRGATTADQISAGSFDWFASSNTARILSWGSSGVGGAISFWTGSGGSGTLEYMRVASTGNVGIRRTDPGYALDVVGTVNASAVLVNGTPLAASGGGGFYKGNNGDVNPSGYGDIFRVHSNTMSANIYISSGNNSLAAGPITIATGYRLQINTGARVAIV